jgi:hypothetical protein
MIVMGTAARNGHHHGFFCPPEKEPTPVWRQWWPALDDGF